MSARPTSPDPSRAPGSGEAAVPAERSAALSQLFHDHNRALVNFLCKRLPDEQDAREVAQEAYVKLLKLDERVAASHLRFTLFKIARDIAIDRNRQQSTRDRLDRLDVNADLELRDTTEDRVIAAEELAGLLKALRELPEKTQHAFLLQRFRGLNSTEVAARMKLTDRMVRNHVSLALRYCRYRLDGHSREEALRRTQE